LATVIDTAEWYQLSKDQGAAIVSEVMSATRHWRQAARQLGISKADIEIMAAAFAPSDRRTNV
jgi:serine/threonine-protein kinase HipA